MDVVFLPHTDNSADPLAYIAPPGTRQLSEVLHLGTAGRRLQIHKGRGDKQGFLQGQRRGTPSRTGCMMREKTLDLLCLKRAPPATWGYQAHGGTYIHRGLGFYHWVDLNAGNLMASGYHTGS